MGILINRKYKSTPIFYLTFYLEEIKLKIEKLHENII